MWLVGHRAALFVLAAAACGGEQADASGSAKLDDVCGETSPFRVLEADADGPRLVGWSERFVDGRRILGLHYAGEGEADGRRELWSVGPCGENPILLLDGTSSVGFYEAGWPDVLMHGVDGKIWAVDPHGKRDPNPVFEAVDDERRTPHGLLGLAPHDADTVDVILQPWPEDPWGQEAERVVLAEGIPKPDELLWGFGDYVHVLTADDELVRISLADRTVETLASAVKAYEVGGEAPYVVWQHLPPDEDPDASTGTVVAWNSETGETIEVTQEGRSAGLLMRVASDHDVLMLGVGPDGMSTSQIIRLPSLESVASQGSFGFIVSGTGDGRILVGGFDGKPGPYSLLDAETGMQSLLLDARGPVWYGDDAISVPDGLSWPANAPEERYGVLQRAWYADGRTETLAARVTAQWLRLEDDRIVTPVDLDDDDAGTLVLVDPESLAEQHVDAPVLGVERDELDGSTVIYPVPDGDRAGIWLAKLAAE